MKKIGLILMSFLLAFMVGCGKEIKTIADFKRFESMTKETEKIEVCFDNNTGVPFYFNIFDQAEIDEIMEIIFSTELKNAGNEPSAGDNTSLTIFQRDKKYTVHFRVNKEGRNYYFFTNDDLQDKIRELAREAGAYDTEN